MVKRIIIVLISLIFFSSSVYAGDIYIGVISVLKDNIEKLKNTARPITISMVDGRWECVPDGKGSTGTITPTTDSLKISYNLVDVVEGVDGGWVVIKKVTALDLRKYKKVKFSYRGSGNANTLEFKLLDAEYTTFGRKWLRSTNTGWNWKEVEVSFSEFGYWWGGNDLYLDCRDIDIEFAISQKGGDDGGSGTVEIKGLEFLP